MPLPRPPFPLKLPVLGRPFGDPDLLGGLDPFPRPLPFVEGEDICLWGANLRSATFLPTGQSFHK